MNSTPQAFTGLRVFCLAVLCLLSACLSACGGSSGAGAAVATASAVAALDAPADSAADAATGVSVGTVVVTPTVAIAAFGLDGFTACGAEGGSITLKVKTHLAYGNNNAFVYLFNQIGTLQLNTATFGSDPIFGTGKLVYCKAAVDGADATQFAAAMAKIRLHLTGATVLTAAQLNEQTSLLAQRMFTLTDSEAMLIQAFAIVDLYEKTEGTFFIGAKTKGGFPNKPGATDGYELARAVFTLQQGIYDQAFAPATFVKYRTLLAGKKFNTSDFYPGKVKLAADAARTYSAKINASMPKFVGKGTAWSTTPALRPTGYYLAAGDVATVTVPSALVNKGFTIQVGAHRQDKTGSNPVKRFFRISQQVAITSTTTEIANPFGGGIYINTPYLADAGMVDVQIKNAVPAPFFSATSGNKTSLADWLAIQRKMVWATGSRLCTFAANPIWTGMTPTCATSS